jgi:hypothetical protein
MNPILSKLKELVVTEELIGFSPWEDGDGMQWGRILDVSEKRIRVQTMDPIGYEDEIRDYQLSEISYFEDIPSYAKRLLRLKDFKPTLPEEVTPITDESEVLDALLSAVDSGEVIRISYPGNERTDVTVQSIGSGWAQTTQYGDLMIPLGTYYVKISAITELTWRNATCESDMYLLRSN